MCFATTYSFCNHPVIKAEQTLFFNQYQLVNEEDNMDTLNKGFFSTFLLFYLYRFVCRNTYIYNYRNSKVYKLSDFNCTPYTSSAFTIICRMSVFATLPYDGLLNFAVALYFHLCKFLNINSYKYINSSKYKQTPFF